MKHNRKLLVALLLVVMVVTMLALAACGGKKSYVQQTDTAVYFTVDKAVMKDVSDKKLVDYLDALVAKKQLTYETVDSYGMPMVVSINDLTADSTKGEYWFIYSDDEENTTEAWGVTELNGKKYYSTNFGIKDQPLKEGATYIFMISKYE